MLLRTLSVRAVAHQAALARAIEQTREEILSSLPPTRSDPSREEENPVAAKAEEEWRRAQRQRHKRHESFQRQAANVLRLQEVIQAANGARRGNRRNPIRRCRIPGALLSAGELRRFGAKGATLPSSGTPAYVTEVPAAWLVFKPEAGDWNVIAIPRNGAYTSWEEPFQRSTRTSSSDLSRTSTSPSPAPEGAL